MKVKERNKKEKTLTTDNCLSSITDYKKILLKEHYIYNKIPILIKDPLSFSILNSLEKLVDIIERKIPEALVPDLTAVWVGSFPSFEKTNNLSSHKDNMILLSNSISSPEEFYYSLIYEMNRSTARSYNLMLMADGQLEREYVMKRLAIYNKLTISQRKVVGIEHYLGTKYSSALYKFLYGKLSTSYLERLCNNIIIHYNGLFSLEEYFAITYYTLLTNMSSFTEKDLELYGPVVYSKLKMLLEYAEG